MYFRLYVDVISLCNTVYANTNNSVTGDEMLEMFYVYFSLELVYQRII